MHLVSLGIQRPEFGSRGRPSSVRCSQQNTWVKLGPRTPPRLGAGIGFVADPGLPVYDDLVDPSSSVSGRTVGTPSGV